LEVRDGRTQPRFLLEAGELSGEEIGAVWYRHVRLPLAEHVEDGDARTLAESELRASVAGILLTIDAYWLNHPHSNLLARHKPLQLALAVQENFIVPETCITDDPRTVRERYRAWDGRMVAKLVGGQLPVAVGQRQYVVYTTLVAEEDLAIDATLSACPVIYQRYVEKAFELRVTVVGDEVFAGRIYSQESDGGAIDWRRALGASVRYEVHALDPELADRCRRLARRLRLEFAGIDLIVTPDGETVFLEVNAAGQWAWLEQATRLPISAAVAERLIAGASERRVRSSAAP
jgi:glutathione synthase/RimK-type ligase-like ATP-grasp enzyme